MLTRGKISGGIAATTLALDGGSANLAEDAVARSLPAPRSSGGMPLIDALKLRRSMRAYSERPLEPQVLSDLLWAADGVNRPSGDRTAPYWRHIMVVQIYAAMADGVWLYEPRAHMLVRHTVADLRAETGTQDFVGAAPLELVYVAHGERMTDVDPEERRLFASADACFIGQNVYLFCASEGLATVFRGSANQAKLGAALNRRCAQVNTAISTLSPV
jgi:hypothetical protein